jgi:hypothetical protein
MTNFSKFNLNQASVVDSRRGALKQIAGLAATALAPMAVFAQADSKHAMKIAILLIST